MLEYVDLVLYIKHMGTRRHEKLTRVGNELILKNARKVAELRKDVIIRVPIIPECNNSLRSVASFATDIGVKEVHLLPYHLLGESKYTRLGKSYKLKEVKSLIRESLSHWKKIIESY